jgi:transglutaminase-like putative cysteine protease
MAVYDDNDTRYAVFNFHNPPENLTLSVKGEIELHRRDLVTALSSKSASGQSSPTDLSYAERTEHLKAEKFIEVNDPVIRKIADGIDGPTQRLARMTQPQGVAASQSADIETVQEILQWLRRNVKYDPENRPSGAASTAKLGKGMCQEFSELFVALCRAKGLPAKYVGGLNTSFDKRNPNSNPSHAWAEVFLTGLGWVPFDPTWMESTSDVVPPTYLCLTKIRNNIALGIANDTAWFYTYRTPVTVKTSDTYKFRALSP